MKDLNSWAEVQGSTLRVHCTYRVRLWRKTKNSSKSFVLKLWDCFSQACPKDLYFNNFPHFFDPRTIEVQLLKDILNAKYGESSSTSATPEGGEVVASAEEGAEENGEGAEVVASAEEGAEEDGEGAEVVASEEVAEVNGEGVLEYAEEIATDVVIEEGKPTTGSGSSSMDLMETLPLTYPAEEVVEQEWPPCPWIPKTSLRRWRQPKPPLTTSVEETSYACFMVFPCNLTN